MYVGRLVAAGTVTAVIVTAVILGRQFRRRG